MEAELSTPVMGASDTSTIAAMPNVVAVHRNLSHWYNNASFALPTLAGCVVCVAGMAARRGDILAFGAFLLVVALCMTPVVLVSWKQTPTAVVLTADRIVSLHGGRALKALPWAQVYAVKRRETQGNVRWHVSDGKGDRIALDGELEDLDGLVAAARRLAGLATDG